MNLTTKGIVLRATNYKESDKILSIFSLELGKISATLKGCRKPNAKLKFAGMPFCFAEFELVKKGDFFTVTNVTEIESFFGITSDFDKLWYATSVLECCEVVINQNEPNTKLFLDCLKVLKGFCFESLDSKILLIKFLTELFACTGYEIETTKCKKCDAVLHHDIFFDFNLSSFVCSLCRDENTVKILPAEYSAFKIINQTEFEKLSSIKLKSDILDTLIHILSTNFTAKFGHNIKSLKILKK